MGYRARMIGQGQYFRVIIPGMMSRVCELALILYRQIGLGPDVERDDAERYETMTEIVLAEARRDLIMNGGDTDYPGYREDGLREEL